MAFNRRRAFFIAALISVLVLTADVWAQEKAGRYRFQSNPWVNLHQRLMHEVRFKTPPPAALSGENLSKWKSAVPRKIETPRPSKCAFVDVVGSVAGALHTF